MENNSLSFDSILYFSAKIGFWAIATIDVYITSSEKKSTLSDAYLFVFLYDKRMEVYRYAIWDDLLFANEYHLSCNSWDDASHSETLQ